MPTLSALQARAPTLRRLEADTPLLKMLPGTQIKWSVILVCVFVSARVFLIYMKT